jgi:cellulose synthase/poly-beta-1,6-N-acetylglucosamine synthase-like glycosyltransferase
MTYDPNLVSIVIPTYKRPEGIARALASVVNERVAGMDVEIVVADNDPLASAKDFVAQFKAEHQANLTYVHVPEPGVSNARNGALAVAKGRYILFLDDDMEARAPWAQSMLDIANKYDAALVFGPVDAVMPEVGNPLFDYMQPLFCRNAYDKDGLIPRGVATGNCLFDRAVPDLPNPVFDPALNQTGGEDDALFRHIEGLGMPLAWAQSARTYEYVPASRATAAYVWKRNFAWGQTPTQEAADTGLRGLPQIVKWMGVGAVQTGLHSLLWAASKLRRSPRAIHHWGRLAQGVGKVLWSDRLSPKLYGI